MRFNYMRLNGHELTSVKNNIFSMLQRGILSVVSVFSVLLQAEELAISGNVAVEGTYFFDEVDRSGLSQSNLSISLQPEFYLERDDTSDSFLFSPFLRLDQQDSERSHADIRQLKWQKVSNTWELTAGVDTVFWGVTETIHLVNIINQVDQVESIDQEDLLGQPMVNLSLIRNWGTVDLYILPYFRERTFAGRTGRPGSGFQISNDSAVYESAAEQWHTDTAVRWSHSIDVWDLGLSHFHGTSREPRFSPDQIQINSRGEREWIPIYDQIHQTGLDVQGTFESWLVKLETIRRSGQEDTFWASAVGLEYSFYDLSGSGADLGVVAEYLYDERDTSISDNDFVLGLRLTFNDIASTEFLVAMIEDLELHSRSYFIEASRRIGDDYKLSLELRGTADLDNEDPLLSLKDDDFFRIELARYF